MLYSVFKNTSNYTTDEILVRSHTHTHTHTHTPSTLDINISSPSNLSKFKSIFHDLVFINIIDVMIIIYKSSFEKETITSFQNSFKP